METLPDSAVVRKITSASVAPITEEPKLVTVEKVHKGRSSRATSIVMPHIDETVKLRGLSSLAVANVINIKADKRWWRCDWDVHYTIFDGETDALIFRAVENIQTCCGGNLQTILVRDHSKNLVARVCYKDIMCSTKLVMSVHAPVDVLVGTVQESHGILGPTEFVIRNDDGNPQFTVVYDNGSCSRLCLCFSPVVNCSCRSSFKVMSTESQAEIGKVLQKTSECLRLQFKTKLDITGKIILTGFCIGLMHKAYNQISA